MLNYLNACNFNGWRGENILALATVGIGVFISICSIKRLLLHAYEYTSHVCLYIPTYTKMKFLFVCAIKKVSVISRWLY